MNIRRDLRGPGGLLAAPLGVALLDTAGINVDPLAVVSPTRIDVHVMEPGNGVARVQIEGSVLREGRTQFFTEGRIVDADRPERLLALGSAHWAVSGPNPGYEYVDSRPGVPDTGELPPLYEAFGGRLRDDGNLAIPELTAELGRSGLHQGPFQVIPEAAAMLAAESVSGTNQFWIQHQGTSIIHRGVGAPLVAHPQVIATSDQGLSVRVELRAEGADDRLCSVTVCRFAFR
jgi:acyl-coenzyme A thioesterase PaaI-like protein